MDDNDTVEKSKELSEIEVTEMTITSSIVSIRLYWFSTMSPYKNIKSKQLQNTHIKTPLYYKWS